MKLIKKIGRRFNKKGNLESWGLFECSYCLQEVVRRLSGGNIAKSCRCMRGKLISESKKGVKQSTEHTQKLREIHKGKKHTEITKQKISKSLIGLFAGEKHPNWNGGLLLNLMNQSLIGN